VLGKHATKIPKKPSKAQGKYLAKSTAALASPRGEAFDQELVLLKERVLVINPEDGATAEYIQQRAAWEAAVCAAKSEVVNGTVQGWVQEDGKIWWTLTRWASAPPRPRRHLHAHRARPKGAPTTGQMLITQVKYIYSERGRLTELTLRRLDAYTPEPYLHKEQKGQGGFKLLRNGVTP
jgi:prophage tail gpP-like protein